MRIDGRSPISRRRRVAALVARVPFAHRGLHDHPSVPENSLAAFAAARAAGHGAELDVRLSRDGAVVVFHDADLSRMTGLDRRVAELTAAELAGLRLLGGPCGIPLLGEVLEVFGGGMALLIELKSERPVGRLERAVLEALGPRRDGVAIQSFDPACVAWFRRHAPEVVRGQLVGGGGRDPTVFDLLRDLPSRPDFFACEVGALGFWRALLMRGVQRRPCLAWTIDRPEKRDRAVRRSANLIYELGMSGVMADPPSAIGTALSLAELGSPCETGSSSTACCAGAVRDLGIGNCSTSGKSSGRISDGHSASSCRVAKQGRGVAEGCSMRWLPRFH